jgi:O-antigen ligase
VDQTIGQGYTSSRDELFRSAWNAGCEFPLSGLGLNGFFEMHNPNHPHNLLLEVFSEGGVPGAVLLAACLLALYRAARAVRGRLDHLSIGMWTVAFAASQTSGDRAVSSGAPTRRANWAIPTDRIRPLHGRA